MKPIPEKVYKDLAYQLRKQMRDKNFYNGTLVSDGGLLYYRLRCRVLSGFIPVWYEFLVGTEQANDFTWDKFKEYLAKNLEISGCLN